MSEYREILAGLKGKNKSLSPKFLYDERGSKLFEAITRTEAYYPTRAETEILKNHAAEMAYLIGPAATLLEPGSGNCVKARYLLRKLASPRAYIPSDISATHLHAQVQDLQDEFPTLPVFPVVEDFNRRISVPYGSLPTKGKRVVFFPGSTIGNFTPDEALLLLRRFARTARKGGGLLIGVDLKKNAQVLHRAYNDPEGVTAAFNLNLLSRLNRDFDASFDPRLFKHKSFYNRRYGRIEMHLVSRARQTVNLGKDEIHFGKDETIHTENAYKYSIAEFTQLAEKAGFGLKRYWLDQHAYFCVYYFENRKL